MKTKLAIQPDVFASGNFPYGINLQDFSNWFTIQKITSLKKSILFGLFFIALLLPHSGLSDNPIIKHKFTADPCALVHGNTVYLYTGHDEATTTSTDYVMNNWHVFSSQDMVNWIDHGQKLAVSNFSWARSSAFAGHTVHRNGKFYWYVPMIQRSGGYFSIGVAIADSPLGPFTDALGKPLIADELTIDLLFDIDPAVFIDDDGQAYIYWGNATEGGPCKMAKLKPNMTEIDGAITTVSLPNWTEAPYLHKRNGTYYLTYASGWPETISYSTSTSPTGPWTYRGILNDQVSSSTNHQSIIEFKGKSYFIYHNSGLPTGGDYRRSVCIDYLNYNSDGTMQRIVQTTQGVAAVNATPEVIPWQSTERITGAHDPTIIRDERGVYTLLTTNNLLQLRQSTDMVNWTSVGRIFNSLPSWLNTINSGIVDIWAPQIVYRNGRYWVYYSGSSFGSNNSAIGVASSPTLNISAANYAWTDHGEVFRSSTSNNYNAIDPELLTDNNGNLWLSFGSFWSGIKMIAIDPATGKRLANNNTVYSLASRGGGAIEGPSTIEHNGYYFLFTSWDNCCAGLNSTYRTMVGRSTSPSGGFVDKQNRSLMSNYSEELLRSYGRYIGPGGGAPFKDGRRDYYVHHYYNGNQNGSPTLQIREIVWDDSNWPILAQPFLGRRLSYEAEHALLTGSTISTSTNASNREYVSNISTATSKVLFYINAFAAGEYTIRLHYSAVSNASHFLKVNNGIAAEVLYPSTGNSGQFPTGQAVSVKVILKEGGNTLEFTKGTNTAELDRIDLIRNTFEKLEGGAKDNGVGDTYVSTGNNSSLTANSWLMFENFDFGNGGLKNLNIALSGTSSAQFRISIDAQNGSTNETFTTSNALNTFVLPASLQAVTGVHDVYVTLLSGSCQLDYLQFDNKNSDNPPVNQTPNVSITSPANNATFTAPALITINVTAADADGTVSKVEFYNGTTLLGSDATSPFSYTWNSVPSGTYTITAIATDNSGATTSAAITVVVNDPPGFTLQAEIFCTADGLTESNHAGFNGAGFLNLNNAIGTSVSWAVNSSSNQTISMTIRYANGSVNNRNMSLSINGNSQLANIDFASTGGWTTWNIVTIPIILASGYNSITMTSLTGEGAPNIDELSFSVTNVSAANCIPLVSLTAPLNNSASCQGTTITLTAIANDPDGTISKVDFYNGATLLGSATTSPYTYSWTNAITGTHSITARATDNENVSTATAAISITVNAVPPAPTDTSPVSYCQNAAASALTATGTFLKWYAAATGGESAATAPAPSTATAGTTNYYVSQTSNTCESSRAMIAVTVNANPAATITAGGPTTFTQGGSVVLSANIGSGLNYKWFNGTSQVGTNSTYTASTGGNYTVEVMNSSGCKTTSSILTVTVNANQEPTVTITSPGDKESFTATANVTIDATASDADGIVTKVDFYHGLTLLGTDAASPYSFAWTGLATGNYTVTAVATDDHGAQTTSMAITINVRDNNPSVITITSPVNNATINGNSMMINVTATDPDGSITKVDYYDGNTLIGTSTTEPYSYTWNNPSAGTHTLTVKVTDSNGGVTTSAGTVVTVGSATGISSVKDVFNRVYPNPSNGQIHIETDIHLESVSMSLIDALGVEVSINIIVTGSNAQMDVSSLAVGIYTLLIKQEEFISRKKIIVTR